MWQRMRRALQRTRAGLTEGLSDLVHGQKVIDAGVLEAIETRLLSADVGVEATADIIGTLTAALKRKELADLDAVFAVLRSKMTDMLGAVEQPLDIPAASRKPFVFLVVGVNGTGKTTTIGKLAGRLVREGRQVVLAAGDTFRAAAIEQIQVWGTRIQAPVVSQKAGADPAAVIFDALASARSRNADVVIADTAGRLQNKKNLMEELKKIRRVIARFDADLPVETLLVLDGGTGQNAVSQLREFHDAVGVTGIIVTKLDGTARGGVLLQLTRLFGIPIRFLGVGEDLDDLKPFSAAAFVDGLLATGT